MRYGGLFLILVIACLCMVPCSAGTYFSENDCPKCTIDGMKLVKSEVTKGGLIGAKYPVENLACIYESEKVKTGASFFPNLYDSMEVHVSCYNDAATASQWYNYEMGTGEKPVPVDPAQEHRSSLYIGKIRCIAGLGPYKKTGTSTYYASMGCTPDYSMKGQYLISFSPDTHYTYQEGSEPTDKREKLLAWDQKYKDCYAGFSPKPAPAAGEKTLHGTISVTRVPSGLTPLPLRHAVVTLNEIVTDDDWEPVAETTTDGEGKYEIKYTPQASKKYGLEVNMTYKTDREYFQIMVMKEDRKKEIITYAKEDVFAGSVSGDVSLDIYLDEEFREENKNQDWWDDSIKDPFGVIYFHTTQAFEFYQKQLGEDIHLNLPLKVVAFVPDEVVGRDYKALYYFEDGRSEILISPNESQVSSDYRPINREFHEFSHYSMTNALGHYPKSIVQSEIPIVNHDGFVNPSTTDSWEEGFAHFMAAVIEDVHGDECDSLGIFGNIERDYYVTGSEGKEEELAVASALWDLYDGKQQGDACNAKRKEGFRQLIPHLTDEFVIKVYQNFLELHDDPSFSFKDDDDVSIPINELWQILRQDHPDFTSVYTALVVKYPSKKAQIDDIFYEHGFYNELNPGNGFYDEKEPYRDANKNATHDIGEYFIDLDPNRSVSSISELHIGTATNLGRPWRRTTQQFPGNYIRVNNAVPFYTYVVEYPGQMKLPYLRTTTNWDGYIYVHVPPDSGAKITVTPKNVTCGNPLVFTSDQFHNNYMTAVKQGYYVSHDFRVSGQIPKPPATPDFSKGGLTGKKSTGSPGILAAKGPLFDLLTQNATSRVPLFISLPIIIAALLVLAYVLKKKM